MCKSVFTFQCQHDGVAEPRNAFAAGNRPCPCSHFHDRAVLTIICPACALFSQALINASQLQWLIEQQANTANNLMNGCYEPPPPKPSSQFAPAPVMQQPAPPRVESKIPVPQQSHFGKPAEAEPKPATYAAAAAAASRAKPYNRAATQMQNQMQSHGGSWRVQMQWEDEAKRLGAANKFSGKKG
ncbi:hypothetical protein TWF696_003495 [Orbilia brochopaga]|uniref:Uncharacterized protein n=1 Tax=Orbilia brochopaga TaxID=3140254 RepID=A0AAV9TX38_9PEZI